tara:strand:+ start:518 stop:715 length:198 start_codon:yes stop_codon:yes gene_type:complete
MDNLITGLIAIVIFLGFTIGLANSIAEAPFVIIVVIVACMICYDFYESARAGLRAEKEKKSEAGQ